MTVVAAGYNMDYNLRPGGDMHRTIKIRRVGRSLGAIFPKELLQELNVGEGDELVVTTADGGVKLSPGSGDFDRVLESFEEVRKRYRNTLRKLAE